MLPTIPYSYLSNESHIFLPHDAIAEFTILQVDAFFSSKNCPQFSLICIGIRNTYKKCYYLTFCKDPTLSFPRDRFIDCTLFVAMYKWNYRVQGLINLEIPVLVRSLKSSNVGLS